MDNVLAESKNILVIYEYERVFIIFKYRNKKVCMGDFYGEPQAAVISKDERYCVVGCGVIIYYLQEPFQEYSYNTSTK